MTTEIKRYYAMNTKLQLIGAVELLYNTQYNITNFNLRYCPKFYIYILY